MKGLQKRFRSQRSKSFSQWGNWIFHKFSASTHCKITLASLQLKLCSFKYTTVEPKIYQLSFFNAFDVELMQTSHAVVPWEEVEKEIYEKTQKDQFQKINSKISFINTEPSCLSEWPGVLYFCSCHYYNVRKPFPFPQCYFLMFFIIIYHQMRDREENMSTEHQSLVI